MQPIAKTLQFTMQNDLEHIVYMNKAVHTGESVRFCGS
jgi:hypothetical protein